MTRHGKMSTQANTLFLLPLNSSLLQLAPSKVGRHNVSSSHFSEFHFLSSTGSHAMQLISCRVNEGLVIDNEISVTVLLRYGVSPSPA